MLTVHAWFATCVTRGLKLVAVLANFNVFGVRFSGPDSGPLCPYMGPRPVFRARFWGLVSEAFCRYFGARFATRVSA